MFKTLKFIILLISEHDLNIKFFHLFKYFKSAKRNFPESVNFYQIYEILDLNFINDFLINFTSKQTFNQKQIKQYYQNKILMKLNIESY